MKTRCSRSLGLREIILLLLYGVCALAGPNDGAVLRAFLEGVTNGAMLSWTGADYCTWTGITCAGGNVVQLRLRAMDLSGTITPILNQLTDLTYLELNFNAFTGAMPSLAGMTNLQNVHLNNNNFSSIPSDFFTSLTSLENLYIDRNLGLNQSTGWDIPEDITASTRLTNLSVTSTNLNSIPEYVGAMPSLRVLLAAYNNIEATPATLAGSNIEVLQMNNQNLQGTLAAYGAMPALRVLWLQVNQLSGPIPDGIVDATGLQDMRLNDNFLVGQIPAGISKLPLATCYVEGNFLSGQIPSFGPQTDVNFDSADFCAADGSPCSIPITALLQFLKDAGYPQVLSESWVGSNPCVWSGVTCSGSDVESLTVASTGLVGTISPFLANITTLRQILLNNNNLSGPVPNELITLPNLVRLDVRNNNISGILPTFRSSVDFQSSGNPFVGIVLPPSSHSPSGTPGATSRSSGRGSRKRKAVAIIAGTTVGAVIVIIISFLSAYWMLRRKKKKYFMQGQNTVVHPQVDSSSDPGLVKTSANQRSYTARANFSDPSDVQVDEGPNPGTSYELLQDVTDNFAPRNILGKGGFGVVYRGTFPDGSMIAVKRMEAAVMSSKGLKEFQSEISVLSNVRHRNLVELKGYCAYKNERLLVYEYMAQGTLAQHLFDYRSLGIRPLEWTRRLSIALDVARGLEYLHGLAHKSFIHRDLKPSNILLDEHFHAKVSDFGLVKLAPDNKFSVETRLAGTFGYLAPEYAVTGRVTTKADVFSFGVILMEILTGKKALDETESEEDMHLVTWFRRTNVSQENFINCIDPTITNIDQALNSLNTVSDLALQCTFREPHHRPDMGHAVNVLRPLVEEWKPAKYTEEGGEGLDLQLTLPQALRQWQELEEYSVTGVDVCRPSMSVRPHTFVNTFSSVDGR